MESKHSCMMRRSKRTVQEVINARRIYIYENIYICIYIYIQIVPCEEGKDRSRGDSEEGKKG